MNTDSLEQGRFHEEIGAWIRIARRSFGPGRPALLLDRDGVIIEDPGYLSRAADMVLIPEAAEVIASANRKGIPVIEITNQAGIGRGYFGWQEFVETEDALAHQLAQAGATVDAVFACPYHREGIGRWMHPAHPARKPRPGMLLAAGKLLDLDLKRSWIVGDKMGDLQAGYDAGLQGGLHVLTGHGHEHRPSVLEWRPGKFELCLGQSIREAIPLLELL